ncbi:hypothetical protein [Streptomyces sp. NPDC008125]|uniref:hypothetical protein n=1 Tax=Streptomyces sp. NPDC008125 TaxID=3364811 RepID=UPI0036F0DAE3
MNVRPRARLAGRAGLPGRSRSGAPARAWGCCYQAPRTTRLRVEAWDRLTVSEQERAVGRNEVAGAPPTGTEETDFPDCRSDPDGRKISFDPHIRRANPRTPEMAVSLPPRRSSHVDRGPAPDGALGMGLNLCRYQRDVGRQFEAVRRRARTASPSRTSASPGAAATSPCCPA